MKNKQLSILWRSWSDKFIDGLLKCIPRRLKPKTMLLIRLDAIGDYVLFRNFIKEIALSNLYHDYHIDLCGNKDWREMAVKLDAQHIRHFIWINRRLFKKNTLYKLWKMLVIRWAGYEVVIESRYSREYVYGEQIVKAAQAPTSIGSEGDCGNITVNQKQQTDQYYTQLLPAAEKIMFEFERNREFVSALLRQDIKMRRPTIEVEEDFFTYYIEPPYVVFFPGGSGPKKRWNHKHFAKLTDLISIGFGVQVVIAGSPEDDEIVQLLLMYPQHRYKFINVCGLTSLTGLAKVLRDATLLISNETCAVHIATAVNTPSICIANGNNVYRFTEYPKEVFEHVQYVYPPAVQDQLSHRDSIAEQYKHNTHGYIYEVEYEKVRECVVNKMNGLGFDFKETYEWGPQYEGSY